MTEVIRAQEPGPGPVPCIPSHQCFGHRAAVTAPGGAEWASVCASASRWLPGKGHQQDRCSEPETGGRGCLSRLPWGRVVVGEHVWAHPPVCLSVCCLRESSAPGASQGLQSAPAGACPSRPWSRSPLPLLGPLCPCSPGAFREQQPLMSPLCSLSVAERPAPPRELLVPQAEVTARSLRLQWVPGSDGASPIRYFTVQVRELPGGEWQTYSSSVSHEATACAVERYRGAGGPSVGSSAGNLGARDTAGQLPSSLAPCTRDQDSPSWSPSSLCPRSILLGPALCRWRARPKPQGEKRHRSRGRGALKCGLQPPSP